MMQPFDFRKIWNKYGNYILIGLLFITIVNQCGPQVRLTAPENNPSNTISEGITQSDDHDLYLKSYEDILRQRQSGKPNSPNVFFIFLWFLILGAAFVWLFRKQWWQKRWHRWFPGRVVFKVEGGKDRVTGRQLLKISVQNNTREGITFLSPMVIFRYWGKERRFRLRSSDQKDMFPLTLTGGTSHRLVIDLDHFYERLPELKKSNRVGAAIETTGGKSYKRFALPAWLEIWFR